MIDATPEGIEIVRTAGSKKFAWNEIHKVVTLDFFAHRVASLTLIVWIEPIRGSTIRFDSNFDGDAAGVIQMLLTHCDYIVRNPQGMSNRNK